MSKDSFIAYFEWEDNCEDLTDEEFGKLMRAVFQYAKKGLKPTFSDRTMKACWKPIMQAVKRTQDSYDAKCEKNRENGKKGGRPKKTEEHEKTEKANGFFENPPEREREREREPLPERGRGREREPEAVAASPRTTLTTTTSEEIARSWNGQPVTRSIQSCFYPDQRRDRTEMAIAICGGLEQFLQLIEGLKDQAYFKDRDVDYDWFVDPKNFQNILEGKYKEPRKKKKEGWE